MAASARSTIVRGGIALGVGVMLWTLVMGFTGLYKHPTLNALFFMVVPLQIGILVWALRWTRESGYGAQVGHGTLLSIVAAPIVFVQSYLFTTVFFPRYFADLRATHEQMLRARGLDEAAVAKAVQEAGTGTSFGNAITGAI